MTEILAGAVPFAKPGRYLAYHAVSGGFILGEIVHAVTGKTIREVLAEEFLDRSYGLMLGARVVCLFGLDTQYAFGHLGFTNILAWADPQRAISVAVLNSGKPIVYPELLPSFLGTMQRITSEMPKIPVSEMLV